MFEVRSRRSTLALALCLSLAACSKPSSTAAPTASSPTGTAAVAQADEPGRFHGKGFSYLPPQGWALKEIPGLTNKVALATPADGFAPNLNVVDEEFGGSPDEYLEANLAHTPIWLVWTWHGVPVSPDCERWTRTPAYFREQDFTMPEEQGVIALVPDPEVRGHRLELPAGRQLPFSTCTAWPSDTSDRSPSMTASVPSNASQVPSAGTRRVAPDRTSFPATSTQEPSLTPV